MKRNQGFGFGVHHLALLFALGLATPSHAATIYVDAVRGFNTLDGSTNVVISPTQGPL